MEEENNRCPECGGVMRLEFSDLGDFWICSNEKCDVACDVDEIGYVFTEEKYYEWQRAKEIEYEFNKMLWEKDEDVDPRDIEDAGFGGVPYEGYEGYNYN